MNNELTVTAAAEEMGVTPQWVLSLIKRGVLPAYRFGWVWIIKRADLDAYIESRTEKAE